MARRVFYSFHYEADSWRASQVRNIGTIEGNRPVSDNAWEQVKRGGDKAIQNWIDGQLKGRSCTIVLIGANTAGRKWINYEIKKSWNEGKGLLGIHIHNLRDRDGFQSAKGKIHLMGLLWGIVNKNSPASFGYTIRLIQTVSAFITPSRHTLLPG